MYRMTPPFDSTRTAGRLGDRLLLVAILLVGALPFLGWALQRDIARWELGVGTAVVLFAGAELIRDLVGRPARADEQHPPPKDP